MKVFYKILLFLVFISPINAKVTTKDIQKFIPEFEKYVEYSMREWVAPGVAVAIVKDGEIIYAKGFGVRKHGESEEVDAETSFQIASGSKTFLTAALAKLVENGKVAWEDKVTRYVPELTLSEPEVSQNLTVLDLVTHRAGLKPFSGDTMWNLGFSQMELIRGLKYVAFTGKFREDYSYQNHLFSVASVLLERVSGKSIDQLYKQFFFKRLGMKSASVGIEPITRKFWQIFYKQNVATPHDVREGKIYPKPLTNEMYLFAGSTGINASVTDMAKWLLFQMDDFQKEGDSFLTKKSIGYLRTPRVQLQLRNKDMQFPTSRFSDITYTVGWFHQKYGRGKKNIKFYSHMGAFNGTRSYVLFSPEEKLGLVVLSNLGSMRVSMLPEGIRSRFLDLYLGLDKVDWTRKLRNQLQDIRNKNKRYREMERMQYPLQKKVDSFYLGQYTHPIYGDLEVIKAENNKLSIRYRQKNIPMDHWNGSVFNIKGYDVSHTYSDYDLSTVVFGGKDETASTLYISLMNEGKDHLFKRVPN